MKKIQLHLIRRGDGFGYMNAKLRFRLGVWVKKLLFTTLVDEDGEIDNNSYDDNANKYDIKT